MASMPMATKRSEVWNHFSREKNREVAICNLCRRQIGCKGSSTTALLNHLKIHKIFISRSSSEYGNAATTSDQVDQPSSSKKNKTGYVGNEIKKYMKSETIDEILARCAAEDGFSIHSLVKSRAIIGYVRSKGLQMPQSPSSVTKYILRYYDVKKNEMINALNDLKKKNLKFSITVDEWTDNSMNRFLNVSVHAMVDIVTKKFEVFVLGLVHIEGTCNAEETKDYVLNKLAEFEIDIRTDIISSTHDAAAVMVKYGKILDISCQLCHNHALHLAITDIIYRKKLKRTEVTEPTELTDDNEEINESIDCDENETRDELEINVSDGINMNSFEDGNIICEQVVEQSEEKLGLNYGFEEAVNYLRKIIRMIKYSSVKNNILQGYVIEQEGKRLQLLLDIKIRWNSLITMVKRFDRIKDAVNKTLIELGQPEIPRQHITVLKEMLDVLSPFEVAVKELSKNSATLLTTEGVYRFLFDKLEENATDLSKTLSKVLKIRMDQRRDKVLMTLMIFLETGNFPRSNNYFDYSSKNAAIALAVEIYERIYPTVPTATAAISDEEMDSNIEEASNANKNSLASLQQQLQVAITSISQIEDRKQTSRPNNTNANSITSLLKRDFHLLSTSQTRTNNLNNLFNALLTIKPTSTATERVFSIAGRTNTKTRTRLKFATFDALIFLKYAFQKMK